MRGKADPFLETLARIAPGQEVRGYFLTSAGADELARDQQLAFGERPWVLRGHVFPLYWIGRIWGAIGYLAAMSPRWLQSAELPTDAESRARYLADRSTHPLNEHDHFGGWDSRAGRMLAGVQGRARCMFDNNIVVTDQELMVVSMTTNEKHGEATFRIPLADLAWTRASRRDQHMIQFGFVDGSWQTLKAHKIDRRSAEFTDLFPHTLPKTAPIPDVFTRSHTEGPRE